MIHIGQGVLDRAAAAGAAQAGRHRHPHVRLPAQHDLRRQGRRAARGDGGAASAASASTSATGALGHFTWDTMAEGVKAGFLPDTTSSDWTDAGRAEHVVDFPNVMSKLLMLGVPLMQVIAMATSQCRRDVPGVQGAGHAAHRRAGRRVDPRAARGVVRLPRQREHQAHRQACASSPAPPSWPASVARRRAGFSPPEGGLAPVQSPPMPNLTRSALSRTLAETDPEIATAVANERPPPVGGPRAHRLRELRQPGDSRDRGLGAHEQVRRGVSRPPLLRRLRVRGRGGIAGDRPRQGALRRRPRQRAAALGRAGQHDGVLRGREAGRHRARHEPGARRPPDARPPAQLLGSALQDRPVRRAARHRADRLRGARTARARAQAEDDRRRRERVSAHHRLRAHRRRGQGGGQHRDGGHGPHRGPRGRRSAPDSRFRTRTS